MTFHFGTTCTPFPFKFQTCAAKEMVYLVVKIYLCRICTREVSGLNVMKLELQLVDLKIEPNLDEMAD